MIGIGQRMHIMKLPVGATHHGRLHNAQATEWREGLDRPGRGHPDLAGVYQPGNMTIDARKKKPEKRKQGRPEWRFMDAMREDNAVVEASGEEVGDRNKWRCKCGDPCREKPKEEDEVTHTKPRL